MQVCLFFLPRLAFAKHKKKKHTQLLDLLIEDLLRKTRSVLVRNAIRNVTFVKEFD